jgi:carbohydrate kinase (thermoresistant glucokinase family)
VEELSGAQPIVLIMGVSGCGKTTIGTLLGLRTGWPFMDADDLHPASNVSKMKQGIPLTDADRWPWLDEVAAWISRQVQLGEPGVVACSALKRRYRDLLRRADANLRVVYLRGDRAILTARLEHRHGHFFPKRLLDAQLADIEEPTLDEHALVVPIGQMPDRTVDTIRVGLREQDGLSSVG